MAKQVQWRRGTTAQNDALTGAEGEITVDLETKSLRVHDGGTPGGHPLATGEQAAALTSQLAAVETYFLTGTDDYGSIIDDPIVSLDWGTL